MKAILLAGGKGTRLRPLTVHTPKPIVPIFNRPFLYYQLDLLRQVPEIDEAILSLNYQPRRIEEIFGDGEGLGIRLRYVVEPMPLGTGGAIRYAGDQLTESVVVFNGDVLTQVDLGAVLRLHRERKAKATIVLTPVENPRAYGLVETDASSNIQRFLEKPGEDEITCNTINAGIYVLEPETFERIPKDTAWSIERSFFPSLIERGETFVAYIYDGYWIDIGTPAKYLQVHKDIMDGRYSAPPFVGAANAPFVADGARIEADVEMQGPCFVDEGAVVKAGARILPYSVIGRQTHVEEAAVIEDSIIWPNGWIGREAHVSGAILGRNCHIGRNAVVSTGRRARGQDGGHGLQQAMSVNPSIFKAYDVRGLYPSEVNEEAARQIGRGFVSYLQAKRIAVSRDMRLSSPSVAAAFIEGARAQGADVVDYGMMGTDMLYYAVARDGHDGGAQITASHNPKQYNGIKMVRREAFPLSGDAGICDIRDMIAAGSLPPEAATPGSLSEMRIVDDYVEKVLSFIDPSIIKPFNVVLDAGNGIGGMVAPLLFRRLPCRTTGLCMEVDGTFPNHEANPLIEENRRDIVERVKAEKADIGIAWDGDADRVFFIDGTGEFVAGDFVTALLAEAFLIKHPGAKVVYDVRASYSVKDTVARYGGTSLMNRVGHAFFKRRMREENAIFGGEVTGHYYFRDFYYADNGFIPALLILELMSRKGQTLAELLAPLREKYFISGEINTHLKDGTSAQEKMDGLAAMYTEGRVYAIDGISAEFHNWHFNVRASNTEPLLRLNLEATTQEMMEQKRDEVLAFIRS